MSGQPVQRNKTENIARTLKLMAQAGVTPELWRDHVAGFAGTNEGESLEDWLSAKTNVEVEAIGNGFREVVKNDEAGATHEQV